MHRLTLLPGPVELAVRAGEPILAAANRAGFQYRRGCRRGGCGVCMAELLEGTASHDRPVSTLVLSEEQRARGFVLTCRAVPTSDVVVRLGDGADLRRVSLLQHALARRELKQLVAHKGG